MNIENQAMKLLEGKKVAEVTPIYSPEEEHRYKMVFEDGESILFFKYLATNVSKRFEKTEKREKRKNGETVTKRRK